MKSNFLTINNQPGFLRSERGIILGVTATVFMLGVIVAGLVCYAHPSTYEARGVFEPLTTPGVTVGATDPETVCEIMTSQVVFLKVVDDLHLGNRWKLDHESACRVLRHCVSAKVQPNGKLVEVVVRLKKSPEVAMEVAARLPKAWGEQARKLAHTQYSETIGLAEAGAENHAWLAKENADKLAASQARSPQNPAEIAELKAQFERETVLADSMRKEALRLTVVRDSLVIPLVVHENPIIPQTAVAPNVPAFFGRWLSGSLLVGLALALPAAAVSHRLRSRRPAPEAEPLVTAPEGNW